MANSAVIATYTSPTSSSKVDFTAPLTQEVHTTAGSEQSTEQRVAYLADLRAGVQSLQSQVNVFLTQKMEEQKTAAADGAAAGAASAKEQAEEENYGEEVVDD